MRKNVTNILGWICVGCALVLFFLYVFMAAQEKEVVHLEHYYIWPPFLGGLCLLIVPDEIIVGWFKMGFDVATNFFKKKG